MSSKLDYTRNSYECSLENRMFLCRSSENILPFLCNQRNNQPTTTEKETAMGIFKRTEEVCERVRSRILRLKFEGVYNLSFVLQRQRELL